MTGETAKVAWPGGPVRTGPSVACADAWLAAVVGSSDDAIVSKTLDGVITSWNKAGTRLFGYTDREAIGNSIRMIAPLGREGEMMAILERIRQGEKVDHFDTVRRRKDGSLVNISLSVSPVRDESGRIVGAAKIARDITERKRWEERQEVLLHELSHRSKNTLAVIQALAHQTGRHAGSMDEFLSSFTGRLAALAAAYDLLLAAEWQGASLQDLATCVLRPHRGEDGPQRLRFASMPEVFLGPAIAINLALAFHELACNSAEFGALSTPAGRVTLAAQLNGHLALVWREEGGPRPSAPAHGGFGTALLTGAFARQYGGHAQFDWRAEGLICSIRLPTTALAQ